MENTTLFNTVILVLVIVLHVLIYRRLNPKFILGLVISSLGTILMFMNPNYRKIFLRIVVIKKCLVIPASLIK